MSISIKCTFAADCSAQDMASKLERIRGRAAALEGIEFANVKHIEHVFSDLLFMDMRAHGLTLPRAVQEQFTQSKREDDNARMRLWIASALITSRQAGEAMLPAAEYALKCPEWNMNDYPEKFGMGMGTLNFTREALALEFTKALIMQGFLLDVMLGKGCEMFGIPLISYCLSEKPRWFGAVTCKTQYAENFVRDHENICRILDFASEEGLVTEVSDDCEFFEKRDWNHSSALVNKATDFARMASKLMGDLMGLINQSGLAKVETLSDPIKQSRNYIRTDSTKPPPN